MGILTESEKLRLPPIEGEAPVPTEFFDSGDSDEEREVDAMRDLDAALHGEMTIRTGACAPLCRDATVGYAQNRFQKAQNRSHTRATTPITPTYKREHTVEVCRKEVLDKLDSAPNHARLGHALFANLQFTDAITSFRRAVQLDPNVSEYHAGLGRSLLAENVRDEGLRELKLAEEMSPGVYKQELGMALSGAEKLEMEYKQIKAPPPPAVDPLQTLPFIPEGPPSSTSPRNNSLPSGPPKPPVNRPLVSRGSLRSTGSPRGQANGAPPRPKEASTCELQANLASAFLALGRYKEAIAAQETAVEEEPMNMELKMGLGEILTAGGRHNEAAKVYKEIVELDPISEHYCLMGGALSEDGQHQAAVEAFWQAVLSDPDSSAAVAGLSRAMWLGGDISSALKQARGAVKMDEENPDYRYNLGVMLADSEKHMSAIAEFGEAIALDPTVACYHSSLAGSLTQAGNITEAIPAARAAVKIDSKNLTSRQVLTEVLIRANRENYKAELKANYGEVPPEEWGLDPQVAKMLSDYLNIPL